MNWEDIVLSGISWSQKANFISSTYGRYVCYWTKFGFNWYRPQGSWSSQINRNWLEARKEIQVRLYWGSFTACCRKELKQTSSLAHSWGWGQVVGRSAFLIWDEGRSVSRGQARGKGGFGGLPILLWCWVQRACMVPCFPFQHPVFASGSSEMAVGFFFFFSSLYLLVQNLPQLHIHTVIFSPI